MVVVLVVVLVVVVVDLAGADFAGVDVETLDLDASFAFGLVTATAGEAGALNTCWHWGHFTFLPAADSGSPSDLAHFGQATRSIRTSIVTGAS